jgi:hypothetical protein
MKPWPWPDAFERVIAENITELEHERPRLGITRRPTLALINQAVEAG